MLSPETFITADNTIGPPHLQLFYNSGTTGDWAGWMEHIQIRGTIIWVFEDGNLRWPHWPAKVNFTFPPIAAILYLRKYLANWDITISGTTWPIETKPSQELLGQLRQNHHQTNNYYQAQTFNRQKMSSQHHNHLSSCSNTCLHIIHNQSSNESTSQTSIWLISQSAIQSSNQTTIQRHR